MKHRSNESISLRLFRSNSSIVILFGIILFVLFFSFLASTLIKQQNRQIDAWLESFPRSILSDLIQGDYVPINSKLALLQKSGLFSSFSVSDADKMVISRFGNKSKSSSSESLIPIRDEIGNPWGFYSFRIDYMGNLYPFLSASLIGILSFCLMLLAVRILMKRQFEIQFEHLSTFLSDLEKSAESIVRGTTHFIPHKGWGPHNSVEQEKIDKIISTLIDKIKREQERAILSEIESEKSKALNVLAAQVAHDIRSPLAALSVLSDEIPDMESAHKSLMKQATSRIKEIANDLLRNYQDLEVRPITMDVCEAEIHHLIKEKALQYKKFEKIKIEFNSDISHKEMHIRINLKEFKRIISNIINNSVDAIKDSGTIIISCYISRNFLNIRLEDDGPGIPDQILRKLGEKGVSFGKTYDSDSQGTGLGLYHAIKTIKSFRGYLEVQNKDSCGALITIQIPLYSA